MGINSKYTTILFDWDGTLAQTIPVWEEAFRTVFNTLHMAIDINEATQKLWLDNAVLNELGIEHDGFFDLVYEQLDQNFPQTALYPKAKEVLEQLNTKGFQLALISNTRRPLVIKALEYHQLLSYFKSVVAGADTKNHKPNVEPYELTLSRLQISPVNCLVVGDSRFDLLGSANAEIDSALFLPKENEKYYNKEDLLKLKPAHVITNLTDLLQILE